MHFTFDNYFSEDNALLGGVVYYFREHHYKPREMCKRNIFATNYSASLLSLGVASFALFGPKKYYFMFGYVFLCSNYVNQIHKYTHQRQPPIFVSAFQRIGLIVDSKYHRVHHIDHAKNYSLFSGHAEMVLEFFKIYQLVEIVVYLITGYAALSSRLGLSHELQKNISERFNILLNSLKRN